MKRFVNRVRYFAMMEGSFQPALRWWEQLAQFLRPKPELTSPPPALSTKEDLLVALATLHERQPEWFAKDYAHFRESFETVGEVRKGLRPLEEQVRRVDEPTFQHFQKLVAGVEVR